MKRNQTEVLRAPHIEEDHSMDTFQHRLERIRQSLYSAEMETSARL